MTAHIAALYRYPVKGLSPELLSRAVLTPGEPLACDRIYAIANGPGRFDPDHPQPLPKITFLMLMRNERLATLRTRFDAESHVLTIERDGRQVARGELRSRLGCQLVEQFLAAYLKAELRGAPRIVSAPGHTFADCAEKLVHIVNLASVRDLETRLGRPVDPLRFRANLYLDGVPAWAELGWTGKTVTAGAAELRVTARTERCDAVNVDPTTAARDLGLPRQLERWFGHADFGVYASVIRGTAADAPLTPGQPVTLP
jgi:uncharacterized protein